MAFTGIGYFSAVLITSEDPARLYEFYKNTLKFPLEEEQHGDTALHYGCELGDLHFAIHPVENFKDSGSGVGSVKMAFEVFDMDGFLAHLKTKGIETLYPPKQMGPMTITALKDPDGNLLEFTQLNKGWYEHLAERREKGFDMIKAYHANASATSAGD
ncbi:MAG: VOC family protein [Planctomycetes bacterium]|nr:VOC family protein [Planctomycetota bacterium]